MIIIYVHDKIIIIIIIIIIFGGGMFKGHTVYRLSVFLENPFIYDDVILQPRPESFSFFLLW